MTMSRRRLPRPVVRDRPAQGDDVRVGDHRHVPGRPSPGHRLRPAPSLHGRDRRGVPGLGHPEGRDRRDLATRSASAARALGAEIRTEAPVERILVKDGRAVGVVLADRARRSTPTSSCPRSTRAGRSSASSSRARSTPSSRRRSGGSSSAARRARSTWRSTACPTSPACPGEGEHLRGAISFSPSIDDMERAYDDAKYGRFSQKPYIDMIIPTLVDPSMAPPGKHVISCFVQYAPYKLAPELGTLGRPARGVRRRGRRTGSPSSRRASATASCSGTSRRRSTSSGRPGLTEGNIFQGELSLEQLFFNRPAPGLRAVPDAGPRPLAVRLVDPSGRRDHGRERPDRGARGPRARAAGSVAEPDDGDRPYDAIVIGGGHNGLVTAAYLAKAGLAVLVLERRERVGGAAETARARAGVRVPRLAHTVGRLRPSVVKDLDLALARAVARRARTCASSRRSRTAARSRCGPIRPGPSTGLRAWSGHDADAYAALRPARPVARPVPRRARRPRRRRTSSRPGSATR